MSNTNPRYHGCTFTPPYAPKEHGYLWGYYFITPDLWQKTNINNSGDIQGFYVVSDEQTFRELIADQIKKQIGINQSFFYIYPLTEGFDLDLSSNGSGLIVNSMSKIYIIVQIAKYRNHNTYDQMTLNLSNFLSLQGVINGKIKKIKLKSNDFRRLGHDNDFTEMMTSEVLVQGLIKTPFENCKPNI